MVAQDEKTLHPFAFRVYGSVFLTFQGVVTSRRLELQHVYMPCVISSNHFLKALERECGGISFWVAAGSSQFYTARLRDETKDLRWWITACRLSGPQTPDSWEHFSFYRDHWKRMIKAALDAAASTKYGDLYVTPGTL